MKIFDWNEYKNDKLKAKFPFMDFISIYPRPLTSKEWEQIMSYFAIGDYVTYDEYLVSETKIVNLFIDIFQKKPIVYANEELNENLELPYYIQFIINGCREFDVDFVILLEKEKIAFYIDYDLNVIVNYHKDKPTWVDELVRKHDLYILPPLR